MTLTEAQQRIVQSLLDQANGLANEAMRSRWADTIVTVLEGFLGRDSTVATQARAQLEKLSDPNPNALVEGMWGVLAPVVDAKQLGYPLDGPGHVEPKLHPNEVTRRVLERFYSTYLDRAGKAGQWWLDYGDPEFHMLGITTEQTRNAFDRLCDFGWTKRVGQAGAQLTSYGIEACEHHSQIDARLPIPVAPKQTRGAQMAPNGVRIFISHSSVDADLAKLLVLFLEAGITIPRGTIRCTSVDGYKLAGGDDGPEVLRADLEQCLVVLALITKRSLESSYVLMELGAAWALKKKAIPLWMPGLARPNLGPFRDIHALHLDGRPEMMGLFETISKTTALEETHDVSKSTAALDDLARLVAVRGASEVAPPPPFRR
jgi:hypothetical protein